MEDRKVQTAEWRRWNPAVLSLRGALAYFGIGLIWLFVGNWTFPVGRLEEMFSAHIIMAKAVVLLGLSAITMYGISRKALGRLWEQQKQSEAAHLQVLGRVVSVVDLRDGGLRHHNDRMARVSRLIAEAYGCSPDFCETLFHAAQTHDIGKIGIPDSVLSKPGRYTPEERAVMQQHVRLGAELLSGGTTPSMRMAETVAMTHHERWDGGGYPNGLRADEIPLEGRIAALADVFDALLSERPYKPAWSFRQAVDEIRDQCGRQFDPAVVDAFETVLPAVRAIMESNVTTSYEAAA